MGVKREKGKRGRGKDRVGGSGGGGGDHFPKELGAEAKKPRIPNIHKRTMIVDVMVMATMMAWMMTMVIMMAAIMIKGPRINTHIQIINQLGRIRHNKNKIHLKIHE